MVSYYSASPSRTERYHWIDPVDIWCLAHTYSLYGWLSCEQVHANIHNTDERYESAKLF